MKSLSIVMAGSEVAGFARTGGLGDVLGALPRQLARLGHTVKLFMPYYSDIDLTNPRITMLDVNLPVMIGDQEFPMSIGRQLSAKTGPEMFFLYNEELFDRPGLYCDPETGRDYVDNDLRFAFFSRGVLEAVRYLGLRPDIIHSHDWQAGLIPAYLKSLYADEPQFGPTRTVLTIHNLGYQGVFPGERFPTLGLPASEFYAMTGALEFYGKVNFLKGAIVRADKLTTVSEQYAREIQTPDFGCGLDGVLGLRAEDLSGILNGVDYGIWSPSRDHDIAYRFHPANLSGKRMTKIELMNEIGLPIREQVPLIGIVSRLADQKGFDLIEKAAERLFALDIQMIVLGTGEEHYHKLFTELEQCYPDKLKIFLTFDNALSHKIEAASDLFLMPSRYEPCGLNQMYSLKYGTVPVVRKVGGLADTVEDFDPVTGKGTGFVFSDYKPEAMLAALERAVALYPRRRLWTKLMKNGMAKDYSWKQSARRYSDLFLSM
jgi:starch synthase